MFLTTARAVVQPRTFANVSSSYVSVNTESLNYVGNDGSCDHKQCFGKRTSAVVAIEKALCN